jgi:hypothetical protein
MPVALKITGIDRIKRALLDLELSLSARGRLPVLMNRIGRALRDDAKRRILTQDNGQWAQLGKWQRAKTGRRKVFVKESQRIHFKTLSSAAGAITIIYYNQRGNWKLTDHAPGFTLAPHGKFVTVALADARPLRLPVGTPSVTFRWKRPSVIPARRVFADRAQVEKIARPIIDAWMMELKQKAEKP